MPEFTTDNPFDNLPPLPQDFGRLQFGTFGQPDPLADVIGTRHFTNGLERQFAWAQTIKSHPKPKEARIPLSERKYEIRVEKDANRYFVKCVIINEKKKDGTERVEEEWVARDKDELMDTITRMYELYSENTFVRNNPVNLRLRNNSRTKGHLSRDERQTMRTVTKEDVEKEDQFVIDIDEDAIKLDEEIAKLEEEKYINAMDVTDQLAPF